MLVPALFYVLGICSAAVLAVAVPEAIVRLNWWLHGYEGDGR